MRFIIQHLYIFLSLFFALCSQLIIKWKMNGISLENKNGLIEKFVFAFSLLLNPFIMLSIGFTLLSGLSWMIAMTKFELSYAYPFTALGYVLVTLFSYFLFNEALTWQKLTGSLFIVMGIFIVSRGC